MNLRHAKCWRNLPCYYGKCEVLIASVFGWESSCRLWAINSLILVLVSQLSIVCACISVRFMASSIQVGGWTVAIPMEVMEVTRSGCRWITQLTTRNVMNERWNIHPFHNYHVIACRVYLLYIILYWHIKHKFDALEININIYIFLTML